MAFSLKKWIGSMLFSSFMNEYNENMEAIEDKFGEVEGDIAGVNAAIDLVESHYKLKTVLSREANITQSIPNDITTPKLFETEISSDENLVTYDSATGEFTVVSPNIKLIRVTTTVTWVPSQNGYRLVAIDLNGGPYNPLLIGIQILPGNVGGSYDNKQPLQQTSALITPSLGDKIRVRVRQNSGVALNTSNRGSIALEVYM